MKATLFGFILFTSTVLAGCCSTGCDAGWGNYNFLSHAAPSCCASSCCGTGSW